MDLSIVILTWNEELNLPLCLESLNPLGCSLYIVDSGSTDATLEIAAASGATVVHHPFTTHNEQWSWGLENLPIQTNWVLGLDSDQRVTPELAAELRETFSRPVPEDVNGFYIKRRQIFRGQWIRHGGYYPKYLLKLFRRSRVFFDQCDLLDHHFYVPGKTVLLRHDLLEANRKEDDLTFWIQKHTRYATLVAQEEYRKRCSHVPDPLRPALFGSPDQRTLVLKKVWRGLPLFVRPVIYFLYRYIVLRGWLDGKQGFLFHFLHAFWFRVLVDAKLDEMLSERRSETENSLLVKTDV